MPKLTAKQSRFIQEYLIDANGAQAAKRAGYSAKAAKQQAARLLSRPHIQSALKRHQERLEHRTAITADQVIEELAKLGFANILDYMTVQEDGYAYVDLSDITRAQAAAISEITVDEYGEGRGDQRRLVKKVKLKLYDKRAALETLGKHFGLFVTRHRHDVNVERSADDYSDDELIAIIEQADIKQETGSDGSALQETGSAKPDQVH